MPGRDSRLNELYKRKNATIADSSTAQNAPICGLHSLSNAGPKTSRGMPVRDSRHHELYIRKKRPHCGLHSLSNTARRLCAECQYATAALTSLTYDHRTVGRKDAGDQRFGPISIPLAINQ